MRICFIAAGPFAHVGAYLDHFKQAGHDVHFVALSPGPPRSVPVHDASAPGAHAKWKYPLSFLRARSLVRRLRPDVVHAHYLTSGGLAALACGARPLVVTAHGTDLTAGARSPVWRPLLASVLARADLVNPVSEDLARLARGLGAKEDRLLVLPTGVDTARFSPGPRMPRGRTLRVLCNRRLEPTYDPLTVGRAARLLERYGMRVEWTFAGDGPLKDDLRALVPEARYLGAVEPAAMPDLLRAHDVYVSASQWDGTSLSLLEALAVGLFPVVTRIPANEAWLAHGEGALFFEPGDAEGLADQLLSLAGEPDLAAAAAPHRAKVLARGDRAANMARLEKAYRELVAARR